MCTSWLAALQQASNVGCDWGSYRVTVAISQQSKWVRVSCMQPRCDEPWTEVVFENTADGKVTVCSAINLI